MSREYDPEPLPGDGPDYHAEHAAWVRRQLDKGYCRHGEPNCHYSHFLRED